MRILIAPDKFAGTLSAPEAACAIAEGWRRTAPGDEIELAPMSDGGPGFIDVLHTALGGELLAVTVPGPLGEATIATVLMVDDTAYIESAQACGLHLSERREPLVASTRGVGELIAAVLDAGARRIIVGLGGSATNDAGAGLLAALGAHSDVPLDHGPLALKGATTVDLDPVRERLAQVRLEIAADVQVPLLGMFGASKTFGPQKGLSDHEIIEVDGILDQFVDVVCGSTPGQRAVADAPGAGAAGGLGFALMLLGGEVISGIATVAEATSLDERIARADLVVTGEGAFDYSSRAGKVVHGVAQLASGRAVGCIVIAGRVDVGAREMRALGVESAYGITDRVSEESAMAEPARHLADLAARAARTWSR